MSSSTVRFVHRPIPGDSNDAGGESPTTRDPLIDPNGIRTFGLPSRGGRNGWLGAFFSRFFGAGSPEAVGRKLDTQRWLSKD
jgi:hypothetical protein